MKRQKIDEQHDEATVIGFSTRNSMLWWTMSTKKLRHSFPVPEDCIRFFHCNKNISTNLNECEGFLQPAGPDPSPDDHSFAHATQPPIIARFDVRNSQPLLEFGNGRRWWGRNVSLILQSSIRRLRYLRRYDTQPSAATQVGLNSSHQQLPPTPQSRSKHKARRKRWRMSWRDGERGMGEIREVFKRACAQTGEGGEQERAAGARYAYRHSRSFPLQQWQTAQTFLRSKPQCEQNKQRKHM